MFPNPLTLKPTLTLTTKVGKVTRLIRAENKADKEEQVEVRKKKADTRYEDNIRKKAKRAAIRDHAETILHTSLVTSIAELETQLQARCTSAAARMTFMKEQFHARVSGETPRDYRGLGPEFRGVHGKLKLTPSDATGKEAYLLALIKAMIGEDGDLLANPNGMPKFTQDFIRCLPSLSLDFTNPKASRKPLPLPSIVSLTYNPTIRRWSKKPNLRSTFPTELRRRMTQST